MFVLMNPHEAPARLGLVLARSRDRCCSIVRGAGLGDVAGVGIRLDWSSAKHSVQDTVSVCFSCQTLHPSHELGKSWCERRTEGP